MDETAFNYNTNANTDDGSCVEVVNGCMDESAFNYNPAANISIIPAIGDIYQGGYLFQINEDGTGLVAAMENLTEGGLPYNQNSFGYQWGCWQEDVDGADGTSIGTGYQNTMDIINQGCTTSGGGISAAQAALDAEINGYSDWYLPSIDELNEFRFTISHSSPQGNIANINGVHWSSSEINSLQAYAANVHASQTLSFNKNLYKQVRVIRSVTFDVECVAVVNGCIDETAFNYDAEANTDDGSCIEVVEGCTDATAFNYDAAANTDDGSCVAVVNGCMDATAFNYNPDANISIIPTIGDIYQGGYIFQINDDGTGLVADLQDLGDINWWDAMDGAENSSAQGYDDWYLPSLEELQLMYNTIGQGANNSGGFVNDWYWSTSEVQCSNQPNDGVHRINFSTGVMNCWFNFSYWARAIRAVTFDDGSCIEVVNGCIDSTAYNYNADANTDDGSCVEAIEDVWMRLHLIIMQMPILMMDRV